MSISISAERQHGIVSRSQLLELGFSESWIDRRVASGTLRAVLWGIYAVGHRALRPQARLLAAVLAAGDGAALSHRFAAAQHGLRPTAAEKVDVTVPDRRRGPRGVRVHHAPLPPEQVTEVDGIRVTTVERTIVDLAAVVRPAALRRALEAGEAQRVLDWRVLGELVADGRGRRGIRALRAIIAEHTAGTRVTKSELEASFLELLKDRRLPLPETNVVIAGFEVDCVWRDARLIVELDSHRHHRTAAAFERDRRRDRALAIAGWRAIRVTAKQLGDELASDLARLLRTP